MKMFKYILKLFTIGILIGFLISIYQLLAHFIINKSYYLLNYNNISFLIIILISIGIFLFIFYINKKHPGYYGSGIPQIEAYYRDGYIFSPYKMLIFVSLNSLFAFFTGFLLGSEGPSVSIGTSIAMIKNKIFKEVDKEESICGGSAGFACAFSSPLAGICHLIEENKSILSIKLIMKGLFVIIVSFIVCYLIYPHNLLPYYIVSFLPLKYYGLLLVLILCVILISYLYMFLMIKIKDITKGKKMLFYLTIALLIAFMLLRKYYPLFVGNGIDIINIDILDYGIVFLFILLIFRLIGTALSLSSCISGGVVLPTLAIGALTASCLVKIYSLIDTKIMDYSAIFIICGMVITFSIITKAPVTAFVLGLKCVNFTTIIIPLILTSSVCVMLQKFYRWDNIYNQLEKRLK